jgi:hypothetical protein
MEWHPPFHVRGSTTVRMAPCLSLWGSASLVRGKRGILHLILWANSLGMRLVMFDPHAMDSP